MQKKKKITHAGHDLNAGTKTLFTCVSGKQTLKELKIIYLFWSVFSSGCVIS